MVPLAEAMRDREPHPAGTEFFERPKPLEPLPRSEPTQRGTSAPGGEPRGAPVDFGIRGPVASEPAPAARWEPPLPPATGGASPGREPPSERARSTRLYAGLLLLVAMVGAAVSITVVLTVYRLVRDEPVPDVATVPPAPAPVVDTAHRPPPAPAPPPRAAPVPTHGAVTLVLGEGVPPFTAVEITCSERGFRKRVGFAEGRAVVPAVPVGDCTAFLKGGAPASARVRAGQAVRCALRGDAVVCE